MEQSYCHHQRCQQRQVRLYLVQRDQYDDIIEIIEPSSNNSLLKLCIVYSADPIDHGLINNESNNMQIQCQTAKYSLNDKQTCYHNEINALVICFW